MFERTSLLRRPNNLIMGRFKPFEATFANCPTGESRAGTHERHAAGSRSRKAVLGNGRWRPAWRGHPHGSDLTWAIAFVVPYAAVFFAFAVYPIAYGLWMGREPSLYAHVVSDPHYTRTVINTLLYVGLGVNVKMFLALLLSGFFMRRRRWIKALLVIYVLPWALPA